ncbi:MAG: permease-like cell division protein FtsX [Gammaproteobacteria bacterium]|jgi:cell division transport system permease protein
MIKRYLQLHAQNFVGSLGRIVRQPFSAALTGLVIAIALALPAGMRVIVNNADVLSDSWESVADFTVYLDLSVTEDRVLELANEVQARGDVARVEFITRDDALEEFRQASGFGSALDALEENPLPHALVVRPVSEELTNIESLAAWLDAQPETQRVQLDTQWVRRLRGILTLSERFVDVVSILLGVGVLVVIGNTIRLEINNRREEIVVMKLVGGSDGFIRRPFLYLGFWYGFLGALGAGALIALTLILLREPVATLASLYGSQFRLAGLSLGELGLLLGAGAMLGFVGAGLATARHLRAIEPS